MAAQRIKSGFTIDAVEIDADFASEANENFKASPWAEMIKLSVIDIKKFDKKGFDHIISNPPYFNENIHSPSENRNKARHDLNLSFEELAEIVGNKLTADGKISLVGPAKLQTKIFSAFEKESFFLNRICKIKHIPSTSPSLLLMEFGKKESAIWNEELTIRNEAGSYTEKYTFLLRDFLIIF
jgi:tRNA1Val (adenine37-N6)-methyltransferase